MVAEDATVDVSWPCRAVRLAAGSLFGVLRDNGKASIVADHGDTANRDGVFALRREPGGLQDGVMSKALPLDRGQLGLGLLRDIDGDGVAS